MVNEGSAGVNLSARDGYRRFLIQPSIRSTRRTFIKSHLENHKKCPEWQEFTNDEFNVRCAAHRCFQLMLSVS